MSKQLAAAQANELIIALGSAGKNLFARMGRIEGVTRLLVCTDKQGLESVDADMVFYVDRSILKQQTGLLPSALWCRLAAASEQQISMAVVCAPKNPHTFQLLVSIVEPLLEFGCPVRTVILAPSGVEPRTYFDTALCTLESMGARIRTRAVEGAADMSATLTALLPWETSLAIDIATVSTQR